MNDTTGRSNSVPHRVISADAAAQAVVSAVAHAAKLQLRINVAVVDGAGTLAAFLRTPGAFLHSVDIAIDKAYTAASFGFATSQWPQILAGDVWVGFFALLAGIFVGGHHP